MRYTRIKATCTPQEGYNGKNVTLFLRSFICVHHHQVHERTYVLSFEIHFIPANYHKRFFERIPLLQKTPKTDIKSHEKVENSKVSFSQKNALLAKLDCRQKCSKLTNNISWVCLPKARPYVRDAPLDFRGEKEVFVNKKEEEKKKPWPTQRLKKKKKKKKKKLDPHGKKKKLSCLGKKTKKQTNKQTCPHIEEGKKYTPGTFYSGGRGEATLLDRMT